MKHLLVTLQALAFSGLIAGKLVGGYIATWSWWWLLMPLVPWLGTAIHGSMR
jgi:predicted membrane protein